MPIVAAALRVLFTDILTAVDALRRLSQGRHPHLAEDAGERRTKASVIKSPAQLVFGYNRLTIKGDKAPRNQNNRQRVLPVMLPKSSNVRGLHVFLSFHLFPVHTLFIQSKQRIDWDSSPPYGQVAARADAGRAHATAAKSTNVAATIVVFDFDIYLNPQKTVVRFFHTEISRKVSLYKNFFIG